MQILNVINSLEDAKVNQNIINNTNNVLTNLSNIFINLIKWEEIYISKGGTVLIEIENNNNIFSIEVGTKSIGYFGIAFNQTICFCEEALVNTEVTLDSTMKQLNIDFINYFNNLSNG